MKIRWPWTLAWTWLTVFWFAFWHPVTDQRLSHAWKTAGAWTRLEKQDSKPWVCRWTWTNWLSLFWLSFWYAWDCDPRANHGPWSYAKFAWHVATEATWDPSKPPGIVRRAWRGFQRDPWFYLLVTGLALLWFGVQTWSLGLWG